MQDIELIRELLEQCVYITKLRTNDFELLLQRDLFRVILRGG